jgi:APA family basic amino acid/polyamine antiporter
LTGIAANPYAGPYVLISYVIAGCIGLITAFCYAEFSARVKDISGSSYSFIYYSLGELMAFLVGWMLFTGKFQKFGMVFFGLNLIN